ncbi:TonB-dependent receptor [Pacificimonas sp. ICDLI1SI03]
MPPIRMSLLACAAIIPAHAAMAQSTGGEDFHNTPSSTIVVTAPAIKQLDVLSGTSVVQGDELQRNMNGQLGEVLAKLPGVSATSFSPGASRPVLRGFQGERVRVLTDGIGTIDASNTSADHGVSIDPLTAERVEVLRGPAVLLYGSQAIGGAVNVIDKRIPRGIPEEPVHVDAMLGTSSAYNLYQGGASIDVPVGDIVAFHVDGSYSNTDDVEVGGYTVAPQLRAELLAEAAEDAASDPEEAEELREAAEQRGVLPNSFTETYSLGAGFAVDTGESNLGFSVGYYDSNYGVPGRPGTGHHHGEEEGGEHADEDHAGEEHDHDEEEHGEEQVSIALEQFRADMRGSLALGDGFFSALNTRAGYSNYTHTEFEGEEVGTVFDVQGVEGRFELIQKERAGWRGAIGGQYYYRDFQATGAEAFVAPNMTDQYALFALQEFDVGPLELELAGRYEHTDVSAASLNVDRNFNTYSGAASLIYGDEGGLRFGVTGSRAERAPGAEELFANGPHIATQEFEIGDVNLAKEKMWGVEGFVRGQAGPATLSFSVYQNWFDDYIYLQDTGLEEDDLPIFQYFQDGASYFGLEGEASVPFVRTDGLTLLADLRGDYIRADLDDDTPLPRIPPLSLLGALEAQTGPVDGRIEVEWVDAQTRTAPVETATNDFTFVNASIAWRPFQGDDNITIMAQANNIFDVVGRRHASFTKDFVPLAGRDFRLSARLSF